MPLGLGLDMMEPEELKKRIWGPIVSIPTPFTANHDVDYDGVRRIIDVAIEGGIKVILTTAGDSQFQILSMDEIKKLTKVMVEHVAGRATVMAGTWSWWTGALVKFAKYVEQLGADGLMILLTATPFRQDLTDEAKFRYYKAVADETRLGLVLQGHQFISVPLIRRIVDEIDQVVGMKEDGGDRYYYDIVRAFSKRLAIFCGGQKWRFLNAYPYGSVGFLSVYGSFQPKIATDFYSYLVAGDLKKAMEIERKYDQPLFDFGLNSPKGFQATWAATLELFGVAQRWMRPPAEPFTQQEMEKLREMFVNVDLNPIK